MSWTLDKSTNIWKCTKYSDLDAVEINNFAEYGQPAGPYDRTGLFLHDFNPDFANIVVEMPQLEVMTNGYGKNLLAESFPITNRFLNEALPFPNGTYTFDEMVALGFATRPERRKAGNLYLGGNNGFTSGGISADSAAYIHGTVAAALMAGTKFVYTPKLRQVNAEIGAVDDNWDFNSSTIPAVIEVIVEMAAGPDNNNLEGPIRIQFRGPGRRSLAEKITDEPEKPKNPPAKEPAKSDSPAPKETAPPEGNGTPVLKEGKGGVTGTHPILQRLPIPVSPTTSGKGKNTIRMELIPVACWKLNNVRFAFGSSFVLPESRDEFLELSQLRKEHPGAPLSVFGHADPVSDDVFNKKLSGHRADSIYAVLIRDTARWEELYLAGGQSEGWGIASVQQALAALRHDPGPITAAMNPQTKKAVEQFQGKSELRVDGIPGPKTRNKLFAAYMDFLCPEKVAKSEFLAKGADAHGKGDVQGCGEFNPVMLFSTEELKSLGKPENKSARNAGNEVNRRVMVLLFRPGTSVPPDKWPCPRTNEGVDACHKRFWSDGEHRRSSQAAHREFSQTQDTFACRFYHRLVIASPCEGVVPIVPGPHWIEILLRDESGKPAAGINYKIQLPDGKNVTGRLDANGKARYDDIPPGKCNVTFPDLDGGDWGAAQAPAKV